MLFTTAEFQRVIAPGGVRIDSRWDLAILDATREGGQLCSAESHVRCSINTAHIEGTNLKVFESVVDGTTRRRERVGGLKGGQISTSEHRVIGASCLDHDDRRHSHPKLTI